MSMLKSDLDSIDNRISNWFNAYLDFESLTEAEFWHRMDLLERLVLKWQDNLEGLAPMADDHYNREDKLKEYED